MGLQIFICSTIYSGNYFLLQQYHSSYSQLIIELTELYLYGHETDLHSSYRKLILFEYLSTKKLNQYSFRLWTARSNYYENVIKEIKKGTSTLLPNNQRDILQDNSFSFFTSKVIITQNLLSLKTKLILLNTICVSGGSSFLVVILKNNLLLLKCNHKKVIAEVVMLKIITLILKILVLKAW